MKYIVSLIFVVSSFSAYAQRANIKDIPVGEDTNIAITKGEKSKRNFDILEQTAEIEGEPVLMAQDARESWKKACADWKTETKEMNKENQILSISCNHATCSHSDNATTTCVSTGTFKIKTRVRE